MEIILCIFFFSLASAVCIQLFAKAHLLSARTINQNHAVIQAQNLAESYIALDGDLAAMKQLYPASQLDTPDTLSLYFDKDWGEASSDIPYFQASLQSSTEEDAGLIHATITVWQTAQPELPIFSLNVDHHIAERRDGLE